jgi:hypothetical protein
MTRPNRSIAGRPLAGWVLLASGLLVAFAYLGGTALSGRMSPLAHRPLLDGLAPPPPYRWVKPPPEVASANKPPSGVTASVQLGPSGTAVTAISTNDGQANLLLDPNAIAPSPGDRSVKVEIQPADPATLAALPPDLAATGNAYRIRFSYQPSGKPVTTLAGKATISLVFALLPIPVTSAFDNTILASPDGGAWTKQASTATPGTHQVASTLKQPGYVMAAVPPAPPEQAAGTNRTPLIIGLVAAALVVAAAALLLVRRVTAARAEDDEDYDDDYDEDDWDDDGEEDPVDDPGPGRGERR